MTQKAPLITIILVVIFSISGCRTSTKTPVIDDQFSIIATPTLNISEIPTTLESKIPVLIKPTPIAGFDNLTTILDIVEPITPENADQLELITVFKDANHKAVGFNPNGSTLAFGGEIWNLSTAERLAFWDMDISDRYSSLVFSPDGKTLLLGIQTVAEVRDSISGEIIWTMGGDGKRNAWLTITDVAISPDGATIALVSCTGWYSSGYGTTLELWGFATRDRIFKKINAHNNTMYCTVAFNPDGNSFATGGMPKIKIWDTSTGEVRDEIGAIKSPIFDLSYNPDGSLLAAISKDGMIKVWNVNEGNMIYSLDGTGTGSPIIPLPQSQDKEIGGIAFNPEGTVLASLSLKRIRLWQVDNGTLLADFERHGFGRLEFNSDGTLIATSDLQGIAIWGIPPEH